MPAVELFLVLFGWHLAWRRWAERTNSDARTGGTYTARRSSRVGSADRAQGPWHRSRSRSLSGKAPERGLKTTGTGAGGKWESLSRDYAEFTTSVLGWEGHFSGMGPQ